MENLVHKEEFDLVFKIVVVGDIDVGKSAFISRVTGNWNAERYIGKIGVDFKIRTIELNGKTIKLQFWDTAGEERFKTLASCYYRDAHGFIVVYDVTNQDSYEHLSHWFCEIYRHAPENVKIILVGNKIDLARERLVDSTTAQDFARSMGIPFLETSAQTGLNVQQLFSTIRAEIVENSIESALQPGNNFFHIGPTTPVRQGGCGCC
ncbi:ras-related protein Rab-1B-like isoform X2 [Acropora muricata]|uniref:ras-related protein Rab-1B-like isoform X2 n=1 Tax=Acropora muricata TaxID=159855 RepID=UPI0034E60C10